MTLLWTCVKFRNSFYNVEGNKFSIIEMILDTLAGY